MGQMSKRVRRRSETRKSTFIAKRKSVCRYEGKVALVTGASMPKGIGKFTALTLAKQGADVVVTGWNNIQGAQAVADEIKAMGRK